MGIDHDDLRLISAALAGDMQAFHGVVERWAGEIRIHCSVRGARGFMLDELVQDAFVTAWQRRAQCRSPQGFVAWLRAIARNQLAATMRRQLRETELDPAAAALAQRVVTEAENDECTVLPQLQRCVDELSPQLHDLITARYQLGEAVRSIAQRLGRSESWVKVSLFRTRAALRRCVEDAS
ncbi:MAG: sigma-70 family RNA polymerase sigma factor [Planctomycetota bacterium]|jgi:RNA polymerase sigma-70 factor (ECF subfamily)|nr:sigma-70 family RNA polymerase sigma factor [Planctomycetota bacterium]